MRSLRSYLITAACLLVVLVVSATALLVWQLHRTAEVQAEQQRLETARALSQVVDDRLQGYLGILHALRQSEALQRRDWQAFDRQARAVLAGEDAWIMVGDRTGRQLVNTRLPLGTALPTGPRPDAMWAALDRGEDHICNLAVGRLVRDILCVDTPVFRDGKVTENLSIIFSPKLLKPTIDRQRMASGRFGTIVDRNGRIVWRNVGGARFVGRFATPDLLAALQTRSEGAQTSVSVDGVPTYIAFSRSPVSGWTFVVAVPRQEAQASLGKAVAMGVAVAVILLASSALVGVLAARRLSGAIGQLSHASQRIAVGQPPAYQPSGLAEIDAVGRALDAAISERDKGRERFDLAQDVGGIGAWEWDIPSDEGRVTETYRRMHGLPMDAGPLKLAQVLAVIHPEDLAGYQARLAAARRTPEPSSNAYRVIHPDGTAHWLASKGRPVFDADGRLVGALGIVRDATAERVAEQSAALAQSRLTMALRAGQMAVWEVTPAGELISNPELNALVGWPTDVDPTFDELAPRYLPGELERIRAAVAHTLERGERYFEIEYRFRRADDQVRWFSTRAQVLSDAAGEPAGALGIAMDVTDRKTAEERLHLLAREVDHRANNLMTVIQGTVSLSRADSVEELRDTIIGRVHALARAHQLLSASRWEGADLRQLVDDELRPFTLGEPDRVHVEGPRTPMPPAPAQAIAMALHELATNAAKYGALSAPAGKVHVKWIVADGVLRMRWTEEGGPKVVAPARRGFGTSVLQRALAGPLGGSTRLSWPPEGLLCDMELPL